MLEPLHFVNLTFKDNSASGKMKTLQEAILIEDFKEIRSDYDRLELALFVLNCVNKVSLEGDQNSEFLFNLTGHALRAIAKSTKLDSLKLHFCLKFLYQQGVISIENWMHPYLKVPLAESDALTQIEEINLTVTQNLNSIESMVLQYIKTADTGL